MWYFFCLLENSVTVTLNELNENRLLTCCVYCNSTRNFMVLTNCKVRIGAVLSLVYLC